MALRTVSLTIAGLVLGSLGLLWLVQGLGIVHLRPILCVADCEPVTGPAPVWVGVGAVTLVVGAAVVWIELTRVTR